VVPHAKFTCLPIGLENRYLGPGFQHGSHGSVPEFMLGLLVGRVPATPALDVASSNPRHTLALWNVATFPGERGPLRDRIGAGLNAEFSWVDAPGGRLSFIDYYRTTLAHAAVLSPRGNGWDCVKTWEALLLGRMPVVRSGPLDRLYEGLPVLILPTWEDLNETIVLRAVRDFAARGPALATERLFLPYWLCRVGTTAGRRVEFCSRDALLAVLSDTGREFARAARSLALVAEADAADAAAAVAAGDNATQPAAHGEVADEGVRAAATRAARGRVGRRREWG
jgi:hypothetical protein